MTPERWKQIRDVLEKALDLAPGERSVYLNQACSSDPSLRQEVETLLASGPDVRSSFLQSSTLRVTLMPGTKLGEYEVKSLLGSGGMGEVYRARDSRLGRDVAIKVLPSLLSADSERMPSVPTLSDLLPPTPVGIIVTQRLSGGVKWKEHSLDTRSSLSPTWIKR